MTITNAGTLRPNWITLQLQEAKQSFAEAPAYLYHGSPLQNIKAAVDAAKETL